MATVQMNELEESYRRYHYVVGRVVSTSFKGLSYEDQEEAYAVGCACVWEELNKPIKEIGCALSTYLRNQVFYAISKWLSEHTTGTNIHKYQSLKEAGMLPEFKHYDQMDDDYAEYFLDSICTPSDEEPLKHLLRRERVDALNMALSTCTPKQRQAVIERVFAGRSSKYTADRSGVTEGAVQEHYRKGVEAVRKAFTSAYN